jgi:hypothetical protein
LEWHWWLIVGYPFLTLSYNLLKKLEKSWFRFQVQYCTKIEVELDFLSSFDLDLVLISIPKLIQNIRPNFNSILGFRV